MGSYVAVEANSSTSLIPQRFFICANTRTFHNCTYQYGDTYRKTLLSSYMCSKAYAQMDFFIYIRKCASRPIQVSSPHIALSVSPTTCSFTCRPSATDLYWDWPRITNTHIHIQLTEEAEFYFISSCQAHPNPGEAAI